MPTMEYEGNPPLWPEKIELEVWYFVDTDAKVYINYIVSNDINMLDLAFARTYERDFDIREKAFEHYLLLESQSGDIDPND